MIYCVEDDINIRELIIYTLNNTGFKASGFQSGSEMFKELNHDKPELILLDIMMPNENGIEILKSLRNNPETRHIPVIMLTAKSNEYDKVIALDYGADDYVTKPFGMMELISRIKAVLRRTSDKSERDVLNFHGITIDERRHEVLINGELVDLTVKEFELLSALVKSANLVLTRDVLLEKIWGYTFDGETRTIDVHIRSLRKKLGKYGDYIETVHGIGYKIGKKDEK
ncbi:Phosphate regulon transcriptional regulatory protein PhoB [bioreactor metagenome]|uniref:Phosphate regulon transcriptional regulatory protein PhoB n=1 Tax=bioreactor metagenome TaxID=1076179 RepID=A0A644YYC2_9ZZZZ|nr:response regulator transcription factor [Erysipelotrichaceae bacterium]